MLYKEIIFYTYTCIKSLQKRVGWMKEVKWPEMNLEPTSILGYICLVAAQLKLITLW